MLDHVDVAVGNRAEAEVAVGPPTRTRRRGGCWTRGVAGGGQEGGGRRAGRHRRRLVDGAAAPVEVVCGLGAGDAFGGALVHGLLAGWDPVAIALRERRWRDRRGPAGLRGRHAHAAEIEELLYSSEACVPRPHGHHRRALGRAAAHPRHRPGGGRRAYTARRRPGTAALRAGTLFLVAADHPARGALGIGGDPIAMADRRSLLDRLLMALADPRSTACSAPRTWWRSCCCSAGWRTRSSSAR